MKKSILFPLSLIALTMSGCDFSGLFPTDSTSASSSIPTSEVSSNTTAEPTQWPSLDPTSEPTSEATSNPTSDPTSEATSNPTSDPTSEPTTVPSSELTSTPTSEPTTVPTSEPTSEPTTYPTSSPTSEASSNPTSEPSSSTSEDLNPNFSMVNDSGLAEGYVVDGTTYTINTAGSYTLSGELEGRIVVEVGSDDQVELVLNGVAISSSENSPIWIKKADEVKIKAQKKTENTIDDNRAAKTEDNDEQGEGAIHAKCDLHFVGKGKLVITGLYNNGIHCTKDLKIKNLDLAVYATNHAIKGNNGINILNTDTKIKAVAKGGDGLKANDASVTSKGNQKGTISITGGTIDIDSYADGIDAAYNVEISEGVDEDSGAVTVPNINIVTNKYADYTKRISRPGPGGGWSDQGNPDKAADSAKGIKAHNIVNISGGTIYAKAYDDGIHAKYDYLVDSDDVSTGVMGEGNINISGGDITLNVSDDGVHADRYTTITGGNIVIETSYEGVEGNFITFEGGTVYVNATDDGINVTSKQGGLSDPAIYMKGGYVDVTVTGQDVDGIDSNGTYQQSGGTMVTRGTNGGMSTGIDTDKGASISNGTLVCLGAAESSPTKTSNVIYAYKSGSFSAGTYILGPLDLTIVLQRTFNGVYVWSSELSSSSITFTKQ